MQAREASKELLTDSLFDNDENGGQIDAFRHAFWMALLSHHICWRKALNLGVAHEKGNYQAFLKEKREEGFLHDSIGGEMDLINNRIGIETGKALKKTPDEELKLAVRDSVLTGKMKVIRKNSSGSSLDCKGNVIDTVKYNHQWNIPRCLVPSDYKRR